MKPVELTLFHTRIPLRKAIKHASHRRTETDNLVARLVLADGTVGHGEGVPREYVTGESIDSARELLRRSDLPAQFEPCSTFAAAIALAERLRLAPVPGDDRQCQGNAARCAVELALLDAYGKHFGEPLSAVTRSLTPDLYQPRDQVQYSGMITSARGWKARFRAWSMRIYGFRQVKIKVGMEGFDDVKRFRIIRRRIGRRMDLRVDANEAWTPDEAVNRIRELEPFQITSVEQPLTQEMNEALPELRKAIHTPIMLDESLCSMIDGENAVSNGWCDLFNIRLSKCGGFIPSLRLAQFARRHGIGYQLGCQVGETAALSAAGRHFACSVGEIRYLEGSYDKHLVREALGTRDVSFGWGGRANALSGPGLGIDIEPDALDRVTLHKEVLLG